MIESLRADAEGYSIVECCRALGASRSGLYRQWSKNNGQRKSQDAVIGESLREHFGKADAATGGDACSNNSARKGTGVAKDGSGA